MQTERELIAAYLASNEVTRVPQGRRKYRRGDIAAIAHGDDDERFALPAKQAERELRRKARRDARKAIRKEWRAMEREGRFHD